MISYSVENDANEYARVSNIAYHYFPEESLILTHPSNTQQLSRHKAPHHEGFFYCRRKTHRHQEQAILNAVYQLKRSAGAALANINADGVVNVQDLASLAGNYGVAGCQSW